MEGTIVKKKGTGRRKIEIKKIENRDRLRVSFSKRRKSLFKKAAKLKDLCGVDVAIIVQYPGGKVKASGDQTEIYPIIDHYLAAADARRNASGATAIIPDLVAENLKEEKEEVKLLTAIDQILNNNDEKGFSWEASFDNKKCDKLEEYLASLESLLYNGDAAAPSSSLIPPQKNLDWSGDLPGSLL